MCGVSFFVCLFVVVVFFLFDVVVVCERVYTFKDDIYTHNLIFFI